MGGQTYAPLTGGLWQALSKQLAPNPGPLLGGCEISGNLLHFSKSKAFHANLNTEFTWEFNEKMGKKAQHPKVNNSQYFKVFSVLSDPLATIMGNAENLDWVWSKPTCKHYRKTTFLTSGLYFARNSYFTDVLPHCDLKG